MAKKNEFKFRLNIHGFRCSPDQITSITGIDPSKVWFEGEPVLPGTLNRNEQNGWQISSSLAKTHELIEHWNALHTDMEIIASKRELLPPEVEIEVSCVIFAYESIPSIYFEHKQIELLDKLKAELDIDLYCLID